MATKKRKTPPAPRSPEADAARTVIVPFREDRDTDEDFESPGLGSDRTDTDLRPLPTADNELLDLGELAPPDAEGAAEVGAASSSDDEGSNERRLTPTLLRILSRRREAIRLSLEQLARLSGISLELLASFESARPGQSITYDQVVVLSRVLGLAPDSLPGLRRHKTSVHLGLALIELERSLLAAPLLRFEGAHGERFGGDVERAMSSKSFTVRIEDDSLSPSLPRGLLLGFMKDVPARTGRILLLRHRRSALLALRRIEGQTYVGLQPWQPSYVVGGEWHVAGSLEVMLPPR